MPKKDPAALFFIEKWLTATAEMKADCRGWYLNLILHQFDKGDLPNDIEELASLAQVRVSEYTQFEQVFKQVLKHKFEQNSSGRLENAIAKEIIQAREEFKEKREEAGKKSYFTRFIRKHLCEDENIISFVKKHANLIGVDTKNEQVLEQVFKQTVELYININKVDSTIVNACMKKEGIVECTIKQEAAFKKNMKQFPKASDFNGLPEMNIGSAIQLIQITKRKTVTKDDVSGLWEVFKIKNLTGETFYQNDHAVYKHFFESLKYQVFDDENNSRNSGKGKGVKNPEHQQGKYFDFDD